MELVLTKNFYSWMRNVLLNTSGSISSSTTSTSGLLNNITIVGSLKDVDETEHSKLYVNSSSLPRFVTLNAWTTDGSGANTIRFSIGNDNTEANINNYKLNGNYIEGIDYELSQRALKDTQMINGRAVLSFSVSFTARNDITIGEIGMIKEMPVTSSKYANFLFGRIALDTPIELGAGESATFQISIEI
jgi:hypothetical protein